MPYKDREIQKEKNKEYYHQNKEKRKKYNQEYYLQNKEKIKQHNEEYYQQNQNIILNQKKEYNQTHKKERKLYNKEYYQINKSFLIEKQIKYDFEKMKTDINYKLSKNLRSRLRKAIKNNQKSGSAVKDLGCSVPELKLYLESKFQNGMNWDNHGEWHIDHIIPLDSFNLSDREEFLKATHYTNLQPLWAEENIKKGSFIMEGTK